MAKRPWRTPDQWLELRRLYVEGEPGKGADAAHQWPTLDQVAARFGLTPQTVRRRAAAESWVQERALFAHRLAEARTAQRVQTMMREAAEFDSEALRLARSLMAEVDHALKDATELRKLRRQQLRAVADDPNESAKILGRGVVSGSAMVALAGTLTQAQKVGRLALGDTTENSDTKHTVTGALQVENTGEVTVAVTHDLAADPARVAEVARILREAGVE